MKYRLVKDSYVGGYVQWNIERKTLWWWEFVTGYYEKEKAFAVFSELQSGKPYKKREVIDELR